MSERLISWLSRFLKPLPSGVVTTESLKVTIRSTGVKLDIESLITNDRVTRQMSSLGNHWKTKK